MTPTPSSDGIAAGQTAHDTFNLQRRSGTAPPTQALHRRPSRSRVQPGPVLSGIESSALTYGNRRPPAVTPDLEASPSGRPDSANCQTAGHRLDHSGADSRRDTLSFTDATHHRPPGPHDRARLRC